MARYCFIPATAGDFACDHQHHQVIGGCIEIKQSVVGFKTKIIRCRHFSWPKWAGSELRADTPVASVCHQTPKL